MALYTVAWLVLYKQLGKQVTLEYGKAKYAAAIKKYILVTGMVLYCLFSLQSRLVRNDLSGWEKQDGVTL